MLEPGVKGLIPGEAAGVVLVSRANSHRNAIAQICGVSSAVEYDAVTGSRLSQGRGFEKALTSAINDSGLSESSVSFRVSTINGEHYAAWELMFYTTRTYRTRRESFPVWYIASSVGETGAASGAISLILAAIGISGGYAPGPYAMCESASDSGLRGGCLLGPASGSAAPPFRPESGASLHVLRRLSDTENIQAR
jgi:3-oxoacyl-[acyl-carrier-protein] synthase-1